MKSDLQTNLDLSSCSLNDEQIIKYLKDVRTIKKIKGLKLNDNLLTDEGFQHILSLIGSVSNLNLCNNNLTDGVLSMMIKNRDKIAPLRILKLTGNKIDASSAKTKIDSLKKMGVLVNI